MPIEIKALHLRNDKQNDMEDLNQLRTRLKDQTQSQIDNTNAHIELIRELGGEPPKVMLETNQDHHLILEELKRENFNVCYINVVIDRIDKRVSNFKG